MTEPTDHRGAASRAGFAPADPRLGNALTQIWIIAGALAASVLAYSVVAWVVTGGGTTSGDEPIGLGLPIVAVLAGMALLNLLLAPAIEKALLGTSDGQPVEKALAEYRKAKIVGFAFREAAAVLGLMIALLTGEPSWCYALSAATLVAMALGWPSREGLEHAARGAVQPE